MPGAEVKVNGEEILVFSSDVEMVHTDRSADRKRLPDNQPGQKDFPRRMLYRGKGGELVK